MAKVVCLQFADTTHGNKQSTKDQMDPDELPVQRKLVYKWSPLP